eukprot:UN03870
MKLNKQQKHDIFNLGTQPIMNVLYKDIESGRCGLNKWWNFIGLGSDRIGGHYWQRVKKRANILHWTGASKPWIKCTRNPPKRCKFIHKDLWRQYLPKQFNKDNIQNWNDDWNFYDGDFDG